MNDTLTDLGLTPEDEVALDGVTLCDRPTTWIATLGNVLHSVSRRFEGCMVSDYMLEEMRSVIKRWLQAMVADGTWLNFDVICDASNNPPSVRDTHKVAVDLWINTPGTSPTHYIPVLIPLTDLPVGLHYNMPIPLTDLPVGLHYDIQYR